jgi:hypothetical protein
MGKPAGLGTLLVCAGLLGVLASAACGGASPGQTTTATEAVSRLGDIRPPASAIPLPSDRAVGDGIAVYLPKKSKVAYLVTKSGEQYQLPILGNTVPPSPTPSPGSSEMPSLPPEAYEIDPMSGVSLSPGGRYLLRMVHPRDFEIRDLHGTVVTRLAPGDRPWGWSAGGSRLVVRASNGDYKDPYAMVQVSTGARTDMKNCAGLELGAVLEDGLVLCVPPRGNREEPFVPREPDVADFRIETADGQVRREFHVDVRGRVAEHNQSVWFRDVSDDGRKVLVSVVNQMFLASAEDGSVLGEITSKDDGWLPSGFQGDHVLLVRQVEIGSPSPISEPVVCAYWNAQGPPEPLITFPAGSQVRLAGRAVF